jgi:hypothetical protein
VRPNTVADFWKKVRKGHGKACWIWVKGRDGDGYGMFHWRGRMVKAHRFAYELRYGPIPDGLQIRHRCDEPSCVRHGHMLLGTALDNAADRENRGRGVKGRKQAPEHTAKVAAARRGKKWTPEMKARMSALKRGLIARWNALDEGGVDDLDEYLADGNEAGLARTDELFGELI